MALARSALSTGKQHHVQLPGMDAYDCRSGRRRRALYTRAMLPRLINSADSLVTRREATREGFLAQALAKTEKATAHVERARALMTALQTIHRVDELATLDQFRDELIAAAGFSEKARDHISKAELNDALKKVFDSLYSKNVTAFREEIVYRFLITKGDALGGGMRNWTGATAAEKFTTALIGALKARAIEPDVRRAKGVGKAQRIRWDGRLFLFDVKPQLIGNNVDMILMKVESASMAEKDLLASPRDYLACGELKGGIDPAGADEHWKTARSALDRVHDRFSNLGISCPDLFFVGAAIELSMAREIYGRLQDGRLRFAANLTEEEQVSDLTEWLAML